MSVLYTYVCTRSTVDPVVPSRQINQAIFARDVSDAFTALVGGHNVVGRLAFFPVQRSVPNHLLCDGSEVAKADFPELYEFLLDSQGTASGGAYFVLPNYVGGLTATDTVVPETVSGGTVYTPPPVAPDPDRPPPYVPTFGNVDSGGRNRNINEP